MHFDRLILSSELSPKWDRVARVFAQKHSTALTRCNGRTEDILELCTRLVPCVLVIGKELLDEYDADRVCQVLAFGQAVQVLVEVPKDDRGTVENLIRGGCSGVLAYSELPSAAMRALEAMLEGEIWAPRIVVSDLLRTALREAKHHLTVREGEVLTLVAAGLKNDEVAERLFISPQTVRWHLRSLYSKMGTHDRSAILTKLPSSLGMAKSASLFAASMALGGLAACHSEIAAGLLTFA